MMDINLWILRMFIIAFFIPRQVGAEVVAYTQDDIENLTRLLFANYTKIVRPLGLNEPYKRTRVGITTEVTSIQSLDEVSQELTTSIKIVALWMDYRLSWEDLDYHVTNLVDGGNCSNNLSTGGSGLESLNPNYTPEAVSNNTNLQSVSNQTEASVDSTQFSCSSESHEPIQFVFYPQSVIWLPDIVVENSVEDQKQLGHDENKIKIQSNGLVIWLTNEIVKTKCEIDITYYPFDTQNCSIIISTWISDSTEIILDIDYNSDTFGISKTFESGTWEVLAMTSFLLPDEHDLTRVSYSLKLRRRRLYYIGNIILPVLFISFTTSAVFILPPDGGDKVGMGITVLLAYSVYLTIIADNMPHTSLHVSYLAVYLTLLLGITALGVVLAVVVLHLRHKSPAHEVGTRAASLTRKMRRWLRLGLKNSPSLEVESIKDNCSDSNRNGQEPNCISSKETLTLKPLYINHIPAESVEGVTSFNNEVVKEKAEEEITWEVVAETLDRFLFVVMTLAIGFVTILFLGILCFGDDTSDGVGG